MLLVQIEAHALILGVLFCALAVHGQQWRLRPALAVHQHRRQPCLRCVLACCISFSCRHCHFMDFCFRFIVSRLLSAGACPAGYSGTGDSVCADINEVRTIPALSGSSAGSRLVFLCSAPRTMAAATFLRRAPTPSARALAVRIGVVSALLRSASVDFVAEHWFCLRRFSQALAPSASAARVCSAAATSTRYSLINRSAPSYFRCVVVILF